MTSSSDRSFQRRETSRNSSEVGPKAKGSSSQLYREVADFFWGRPRPGESPKIAAFMFRTMVELRNLLNLIGVKSGERTVEYNWLLENLRHLKSAESVNLSSLTKAADRPRLLDVGCGYSRLDCALHFLGYETYAIDVNEPRYVFAGIQRFKKADITERPFPENFFDVIIAVSTLEHLGIGAFEDPLIEDGDLLAMKQMHGMLRVNGEVLVTGPFSPKPILTWHRFYDPSRLALLKRGFKVVKETYYVNRGTKWRAVSLDEASTYVESRGPFLFAAGGPNALFCIKLKKNSNIS